MINKHRATTTQAPGHISTPPARPGARDAGKARPAPPEAGTMATRRGPHKPITDAEKDRIFALHGDGLSCAQIAKEIGRGKTTVANHAAKMGLNFDRHLVMEATQARIVDARARRAALVHRLLDEAEQLLDRLQKPYTVWRISNDGDLHTGKLELPDARDQRDLMLGAATAIDKSLRLEQFDADPGINGAKSMLGALAAGLGQAYNELNPPAPDDGA
jgi:hypothetical protein